MLTQPKQQPVAVCTVCGSFGYSTRYIGERCGKPNGGRRCAGIRARVSPDSWKRCPRCNGTGQSEDAAECTFCWNRGWLYVRPSVPAPVQD